MLVADGFERPFRREGDLIDCAYAHLSAQGLTRMPPHVRAVAKYYRQQEQMKPSDVAQIRSLFRSGSARAA